MRKKVLGSIIIFILIIITVFAIFDFKKEEDKLHKLSNSNVTSITLEHYGETITIDPSDPNFLEIIELSSDLKLSFRYIGLPLYGIPINVTFESNDKAVLEFAPSLNFIIVNNKRFYSSFRSKNSLKKLDSILGEYYGYTQ